MIAINQIIRYPVFMKEMSATEASRNFSALLDAIEAGEEVVITRGNRAVAEIRQARTSTGRALRQALEGLPPLDEDLEKDILEGLAHLRPWKGDLWEEN